MKNLIIKNGTVYDPLNDIEGEVKDILIEKGIIVEKFSNSTDVAVIDAKGKTVIPAAIDIHAHVASQQVNWVRLLGKKDPKIYETWKGLVLEKIAKDYITNGYTTIIEANVFPSLAKQTIFNLSHFPVLDKAMLINVSNLWPLELEYQRGKIEDMSIFLSDLLEKVKGFGFKVYNPFESENWDFKIIRDNLSSQGRLYNFSALDVYKTLTQCNERLNLPHSIHAHVEGYENEEGQKNLLDVLEEIKKLELKVPNNRNQIFHLAHASSYNINGENSEIIRFFNENQHFDLDLGCLGFNKINPLITSDRRLINSLSKSENNYNIIRSAIELEGDAFATHRMFDKNIKKDCIIWSNAIDLALNIKNKYQVQFSINYPNYANITDVPEISTWLLSEQARGKFIETMDPSYKAITNLLNIPKSLSFNEFVIMTRASPARSLGLNKIKGHLGNGADGDMNILDMNASDLDLNKDWESLKKSLKSIEYVIKKGEIIKKNDEINLNKEGKIIWTKGNAPDDPSGYIMKKKREFYQKYTSFFYDFYQVNISPKDLLQIKY